jgi:hypothetical protein
MRVILCRAPKIGSWLIRTLTWSPWSHCAILADSETVVEAVWPKVRASALADLLASHPSYVIVDLPVPNEGKSLGMALQQIGKTLRLAGAVRVPLPPGLDGARQLVLLRAGGVVSAAGWGAVVPFGRAEPDHALAYLHRPAGGLGMAKRQEEKRTKETREQREARILRERVAASDRLARAWWLTLSLEDRERVPEP